MRLFAVGDGPQYSNQREFAQFVLKAKSPGSSDYDVTVLTFTPTHPYSFIDPSTYLLVDQIVPPVTAQQFRAEFLQYTSGTPYNGARIRELDSVAASMAEEDCNPALGKLNLSYAPGTLTVLNVRLENWDQLSHGQNRLVDLILP